MHFAQLSKERNCTSCPRGAEDASVRDVLTRVRSFPRLERIFDKLDRSRKNEESFGLFSFRPRIWGQQVSQVGRTGAGGRSGEVGKYSANAIADERRGRRDGVIVCERKGREERRTNGGGCG